MSLMTREEAWATWLGEHSHESAYIDCAHAVAIEQHRRDAAEIVEARSIVDDAIALRRSYHDMAGVNDVEYGKLSDAFWARIDAIAAQASRGDASTRRGLDHPFEPRFGDPIRCGFCTDACLNSTTGDPSYCNRPREEHEEPVDAPTKETT